MITLSFQVTNRGATFYDPSGAKVNSVTPTVVKDEYGAVYLLVLAQGINYEALTINYADFQDRVFNF